MKELHHYWCALISFSISQICWLTQGHCILRFWCYTNSKLLSSVVTLFFLSPLHFSPATLIFASIHNRPVFFRLYFMDSPLLKSMMDLVLPRPISPPGPSLSFDPFFTALLHWCGVLVTWLLLKQGCMRRKGPCCVSRKLGGGETQGKGGEETATWVFYERRSLGCYVF